jgi:hypothetical protein
MHYGDGVRGVMFGFEVSRLRLGAMVPRRDCFGVRLSLVKLEVRNPKLPIR